MQQIILHKDHELKGFYWCKNLNCMEKNGRMSLWITKWTFKVCLSYCNCMNSCSPWVGHSGYNTVACHAVMSILLSWMLYPIQSPYILSFSKLTGITKGNTCFPFSLKVHCQGHGCIVRWELRIMQLQHSNEELFLVIM